MDESMKNWIDNADYESLLSKWRNTPAGSPYFQGELGKYYSQVMAEKRKQVGNAEHVRASKSIDFGVKMDKEAIKQLANDVNNVAATSFQSGKEYAEHRLWAENERLKATIQNALVSLTIMNMPISGNPANVATNDDLLKIMADSFREALKTDEPKLCICCEEITEENAHLHRNCGK